MNRRHFLALSAAAPFAARADRVVLNDYAINGLYDLTAALSVGPVELLPQDYPIGPVRLPPYAQVKCVLGCARLCYDGDGPAFQPLDQDRPTDRVWLSGFDLIATRRGGAFQHGIYMPACRHWRLDGITIDGFGGVGVYSYGKRKREGDLDPSDSTKLRAYDVRVLRCGTGFRFTGTAGSPRIRGGASNMHLLDACVVSQADGNGFEVIQGSASTFTGCVAGLCGGDGFYVNWYGNTFIGSVFENNEGAGIRFGGAAECHDNTVVGWHDGGGHDQAIENPGRQKVL